MIIFNFTCCFYPYRMGDTGYAGYLNYRNLVPAGAGQLVPGKHN